MIKLRGVVTLILFIAIPFVTGEVYVLAYKALGDNFRTSAILIPIGMAILIYLIIPRKVYDLRKRDQYGNRN